MGRDLVDFARRLPKAELHCHFEGSIPPDTLLRIARRNGIELSAGDPDDVYDIAYSEADFQKDGSRTPAWVFGALSRKYQKPIDDPRQLRALAVFEAFLSRFDEICCVLKQPDDYREAVYESLVTAADLAGVRYREMYFHPMNNPHVPYEQMVEGLTAGIRQAEADRGIVGRLLPSINRDHSAAAAVDLARTVIANRCPEVVGLASDYDEEHLPAFAEAYRLSADAGLRGTAHAGEFSSARSIRECIDVLGCRRVDHGYSVVEDEALVERARAEGIHFAAVFSWSVAIHEPERWPLDPPASPTLTDLRSPIARMLEAGLSVSLNSDDPAFQGFGDLATEYLWAAQACGLDEADLAQISLNALEAAMLPEEEKAEMRVAFLSEIQTLRAGRRDRDHESQ